MRVVIMINIMQVDDIQYSRKYKISLEE